MKSEKDLQRIKTLKVIETELNNRIKRMKTSTINISISIANNDTKSLGVVAKDYSQKLDEMSRMLSTMDRLLSELMNGE